MYLLKDFILVVFATLLIYTIVEISEEATEDRKNCMKVVRILNGSEAGTGDLKINFEENCSIYTYRVKCVNKSSIIKIKSIFTDYSNLTSSEGRHQSQIQVILQESTTLSDGTKSLIVVNKWNIDSQNKSSTKDHIFYSQTADLIISMTINGNSSDIDLELSYEEIEFVEYRNSSSDREGFISPWVLMEGRGYRPNSVYIFQITKQEDLNANSIHLGLNKLQIDEGIGEYLLIGAGKDVFQGPPPLFISSLLSKKEIKINDENAYIVFVAASTRSNYRGFEITWKYNGTRITRKEDVTVDPAICDESDSMPICIYNISAALNELNKSEESFGKFRERLASLGNEYAKNNSMYFKIDSSQVRIIRVSAVIDKNDTVYVMVKIQHTEDGKAAFDWKQMGHILNEYSSRYHSEVDDGYSIKKCPKETRRKNQTSIIIYAIVPVLCCLLCVLIWNWKQTPFSRVFSKKIKNAIIASRRGQMVPQEETGFISNNVANINPMVYVTDDRGTSYALDNDGDETEQETDTVFNRTDLERSNSTRSNTRESRSVRSSTRSQRGEINMGFDHNEENREIMQNAQDPSSSETNTLDSQKSLLSKNITEEITQL